MDFGGLSVTREAVVEGADQFDARPFGFGDEGGRALPFGALCTSTRRSCALALRMMGGVYPLHSRPQVGPVRNAWDLRNPHDVPLPTMHGGGMSGRRSAAP